MVGYDEVRFLHQPDGALANELPLRELLVREIREFRPDAVLTHDPEVLFYRGGGINHADHRAAGIAAVDAVYPAARNAMAFPDLVRAGFAPHKVRRLYLFWPGQPTVWVEVGATVDRKIQALRCHASQLTMDAAHEQRMRDWAAEDGAAIGAPAAEAFRLIVIDDEEDQAQTLRVGRQVASMSSGRTRFHPFQSSASGSARRPSMSSISPMVRPPAASAR